MSDFRKLDDQTFASPQLTVGDISAAKEQGIGLIINNRPDGEAPDQPEGHEIEQAARSHGIDYVAIPVSSAGFSLPQVDAMVEALAKSDGKTLAFCRSGTRSTLLWAMARAKTGHDLDKISRQAMAAGYDVSAVLPTMRMLSEQDDG